MLRKTLFFLLFLALAPLSLFAESPHFDKKSNVYTVQRGDCLWSISKDVWDDGLKWSFLYAANEGKIHDPGMIYPGQKLAIPPTITKELRQKAVQLVYQERESAPVAKPAVKRGEASASRPAKEKAPVASETEKPAPEPSTTEPSSSTGSGIYLLLIAALLALAGGVYFWNRNKFSAPAEPQKPQPLSSFPQGTTSFQPKPTSSPSNGSTSSPSSAPAEPRSFDATITSISTPAPTSIVKEEPQPSQLVSQSPSSTAPPASSAPTESSQPTSSPAPENQSQNPATPPTSGPQNN